MVYYDETVIRQFYEAFNRGDFSIVGKLYAEDVVVHVPGHNQISGVHRGRPAVFDYWHKQSELVGGSFKPKVVAVTDGDGHIIVITDIQVTHGGRDYSWRRILDFLLADGRVVESWVYESDQYAADTVFG